MKTKHQVTNLDFKQNGSGPAIVFLHDAPNNLAISEERFAGLAKAGFRVILSNLGNRDTCEGATIEDLCGAAVALLNHLGIGRAVIFGIGRGACVLLKLLETHPERIAGSSLVIPAAMAEDLNRFSDRDDLLKSLRNAKADPLIRNLFNRVPTTSATALSELPALCKWLDHAGKRPERGEGHGLTLLAELQIPLLLIDNPTPPARRRWRQRLGNRLHAFNGCLLALLDLLVPPECEDFDEDALGESH